MVRKDIPLIAIALFLLAFGSFSFLNGAPSRAQQEEPLEARVVRLEKEVESLKELLATQGTDFEAMGTKQQSVETWMRSLVGAMDAFEKGLAQTVTEGFTHAGANINSRETLITTLRGVAQALRPATEAPVKPKK